MRRKKSAIVPGLVLGASFAAVVPAIACSGRDPITDMRNVQQYGVAAVAYCCFEAGVAMIGFDAEAGTDAKYEADAPVDAPSDVPGDVREGG